jgi:hypothetical protein
MREEHQHQLDASAQAIGAALFRVSRLSPSQILRLTNRACTPVVLKAEHEAAIGAAQSALADVQTRLEERETMLQRVMTFLQEVRKEVVGWSGLYIKKNTFNPNNQN